MTTKNTKTPAKLADILTAHKEWLNTRYDGAPKGRRADLTGADLAGAVLTGAVLRGADLRDAVLRDGYTRWEEYKKEVVPALCMAGGRSLDEVANPETWACHRWGSDGKAMGCPMATAFNVKAVAEIPAMYRQLANDFIQLFDQHLIPLAEVNPTYAESAK